MSPKFKTNVQEVFCNVGENLILSTFLDGSPIPELKVIKNGKDLTNSGKISLDFLQQTLKIQIQKTCVEDSGDYDLIATNDVGNDTLKMILNVIGKNGHKFFTYTMPGLLDILGI